MNNNFSIDFDWLPREYGNQVEQTTLAELCIRVDGNIATDLEDLLAKSVRKKARLSAYDLAVWFASNWWRLRWEPESRSHQWEMSHHLSAAGGGYVWPDVNFVSDGSLVLVRSRATEGRPAEPIRYLSSFNYSVSADEFEQGVDRFIEAVFARLAGLDVDEHGLVDLWNDVKEERANPKLAKWRKLEALTGFDPEEAPKGLIQQLLDKESNWGSGAIEEVAAASRANAVADLQKIVASRDRATEVGISGFECARQRIARQDKSTLFSWQRAERAALVSREAWSLPSGPVPTETLSDLFKISENLILKPGDDQTGLMPVGFRLSGNSEKINVSLQRKRTTGRRFALLRLVADHLLSEPEERLLPATDTKTERQKMQRAFAQEFLCPISDLEEFLGSGKPSDEFIDEAAAHFDVSPLLIKTKLVNHGVLPHEELIAPMHQ